MVLTMKNTKNTIKTNPLSFETDPNKIAEILKNTAGLMVQSHSNFSEEEKQVKPKQTKQTKKTAPAPVLNVKSLNDPKAREFVTTCLDNYEFRLQEYIKKNHVDVKRVERKKIGFVNDSHHFEDTLKATPALVYSDMIQIANYMNEKKPHNFAMQFATNIAILKDTEQLYVAQKELNKFCETVHSLASGRRCSDIYVRLFALAMVWGYRTLNELKDFYSGLNKNSKLPQELKDKIAKEGGAGFTVGTALAQSGQCKKICKFLGLLNFKKGSSNTPITVYDRALPLFRIIAGLDK